MRGKRFAAAAVRQYMRAESLRRLPDGSRAQSRESLRDGGGGALRGRDGKSEHLRAAAAAVLRAFSAQTAEALWLMARVTAAVRGF